MSDTIAKKLATIAENVPKVYEAGKEAALAESDFYNEFWDTYQSKGNRSNYNQAFFQQGWTDKTYNPKYEFKNIRYANSMFMQSAITDTLKPIDFTNLASMPLTVFGYCLNLRTIRELKVSGTTAFTSWFVDCAALENIIFSGEIGNNIDFEYSSLLSRESIESIIEHLSDTATGKTVTFSIAAVNNAFSTEEWETLVATKTNWTVTTI